MIETREKDGIFLFVYLYYYDFVSNFRRVSI